MTTPVIPPNPDAAEDALSLNEHEQRYNQKPDPDAPPADPIAPPEGAAAATTDAGAAQPPKPGPQKHRAKSQQASPEDVPRIKNLTAKNKTLEERMAAIEKENEELRKQTARPAAVAAPPKPAAGADPEPNPRDPKYAGQAQQFNVDYSRWLARDELRKEQARSAEVQTKAEREAKDRQILDTFASRVDASKAKHPDFDQVAFAPNLGIPTGSYLDAWIMEDDEGTEVLYHLGSHRDELAALLQMPLNQQVRQLALLSQRLAAPQQSAPVEHVTGTTAGRSVVVLPPRPPNPVRTEAHRPPAEAPDDSASLRSHEQYYGTPRRNRG